MIAIALFALVLTGSPQDSGPPPANPTAQPDVVAPASPHWTPEQQAEIKQKQEQIRLQHEPERQEAIRLNDLAANIHSEADARQLVDGVAEQLTHHQHLFWAALSIRRRVAHTEYEAVSDPSGLIPEQLVVDVWNEYVREIDAPEEGFDHRSRIPRVSTHSTMDDSEFSVEARPDAIRLDDAQHLRARP
jgi:hypothetical protein